MIHKFFITNIFKNHRFCCKKLKKISDVKTYIFKINNKYIHNLICDNQQVFDNKFNRIITIILLTLGLKFIFVIFLY